MQVEAVQLQWQVEHCWHRPKRAAHRLQRHEDYAHDESIHWKILEAIDSSWKDDVEHQTQENTNKLHKVMIQHKHRPGDGAKEPYIDEEIWSLRRHKILIKQKCTEIRTRLSRNALVTCFDGWKKKVPSENRAAESQYDTTLLCHAVSAQARLFTTCETMRRVLRRGKQQALQEQLKLITEKSSSSEVLQKSKAFVGPTNPKKAKRQQLPCVKDVNGIPCRLPSEALDIWIAFVFQSMEGGTRLQLEQLRHIWSQELRNFAQDEFAGDLQTLPTLTELELALRRIPKGKAGGLDGIPGELCHHQAGRTLDSCVQGAWSYGRMFVL